MQWKKLGKIFDPSDHNLPFECKYYAQSPQALVFDDFVRIYFSTRSLDKNMKYRSHVAFVDFDKNLKNILEISKSEIIPLGKLGAFDEHGIFPISPMRDDKTVLAYTCGWSRRVSVSVETAIGLAISHDNGLTFKKIGNGGPILGPSPKEPFLVGDAFVKKLNGQYHMWYIFGTHWSTYDINSPPDRVYKIGYAISLDGINWTKNEGQQIVENSLGPDECQALPTVIEIKGKFHLFFCFREPFDFRKNPKRGYKMGHAVSKDLKTWERLDTLIINPTPNSWDSDMICYPNVFINSDDSIYLLYNGNEFGKYGFGLAVLEN